MLSVHGLRVGYGHGEVLHGVDVEVGPAEVVAVVGANGAGKTTLLKTISGLVHPQRGEVVFEGRRIDRLRPERVMRLGIAHIPEGRRVFPFSTVEENLEAGAFIRRDRSGVAEDLERVYQRFPILYERRRQLASKLSGGEQQMLAMSRGLMSRPTLVLMDEPSLGLAPLIVEKVFEVVSELHLAGIAILLVEQNVARALEVADRGYILVAGEVAMHDTGSALLANDQVQRVYLGGVAPASAESPALDIAEGS